MKYERIYEVEEIEDQPRVPEHIDFFNRMKERERESFFSGVAYHRDYISADDIVFPSQEARILDRNWVQILLRVQESIFNTHK